MSLDILQNQVTFRQNSKTGERVNNKTDESFRWFWPLYESGKPQFAAAEVVRLTGLAEHTLQNWANRGMLKPSVPKRGKGRVRLYTKDDLFIINALLIGAHIQQQLLSNLLRYSRH